MLTLAGVDRRSSSGSLATVDERPAIAFGGKNIKMSEGSGAKSIIDG